MRRILLLTSVLLSVSLQAQTEYVNPFIGTTNFGACNPGAVTPNGLMSRMWKRTATSRAMPT